MSEHEGPKLTKEECERWYEALPVGVENARTAEALALQLGWLTDEDLQHRNRVENVKRKFREYTEQAVFYGFIYGADNRGHWRLRSWKEAETLERTVGRREHQARRSLQWVKQMRANVQGLMNAPLRFPPNATGIQGESGA